MTFPTRNEVLYQLRADCYFCPASSIYLDQCALIQRADRAEAKLMTLSDLAAQLKPPGIPPEWHASANLKVWVAAVSGDIAFPSVAIGGRDRRGHRRWTVVVLPREAGFSPQVADAGPLLSDASGAIAAWPAYFDGLPDLSPP